MPPSTRRILLTLATLVVAVAATARAHDMFLKLESFYLEPDSTAEVALMNGTFEESENVITRDRMLDVSIVGPDGTVHPPTSAWRDTAVHHWDADSVDTAILRFETGSAGTYTLAVSTAPRLITLSRQDFDDYLAHDGVTDVLQARREAGSTPDSTTERYSKHVKALVQVGDARSGHFGHTLGYPIEFIALQNPYTLSVSGELQVRLERAGQPVANQLVYASYEGHHGHGADADANAADHAHVPAVTTRTNGQGIATIPISHEGRWYVRTIHMVETPGEAGIDYESNWATLTFEIR